MPYRFADELLLELLLVLVLRDEDDDSEYDDAGFELDVETVGCEGALTVVVLRCTGAEVVVVAGRR